MGRIGCVRCEKSGRDFLARTFALIAPVHTVLHGVSCSFETITKAPKHYATHQNLSLGSNGVDWVRSWRKIPSWLHATSFRINCTSSPCFASSFMRLRNDPNAPKHYATHRNMSLGSNGVDWVRSLQKIPMWLRGTCFCINCTSSHCFAPSFMQLRNDNKCTQTLCNAPKHEFRVQCGGLGVFVEKNPVVPSWHELSH
jgi:hypothetical protein